MEALTFSTSSSCIRPTKPFTSRDQTSSFKIDFRFSFNHLCSHWILQDDPELVRHDTPIIIQNAITFTLDEFLFYKQTREAIKEIIKAWPIRNVACIKYVDFALKKARDAIIRMPAHHNAVHLGFLVRSLHNNIVAEGEFLERVIQQQMEEEAGCNMVPALDFCIESLETRVLVDHHETCSICLEEFNPINGVCEGTSMPCSHIFHGDCIRKWLSTSHYCPICRYEMPTEIDNT